MEIPVEDVQNSEVEAKSWMIYNMKTFLEFYAKQVLWAKILSKKERKPHLLRGNVFLVLKVKVEA